jgi:hypothetical protein
VPRRRSDISGLSRIRVDALTAALKRCATQNQVQHPQLNAAGESHPNVENHDVRMGHPAFIILVHLL